MRGTSCAARTMPKQFGIALIQMPASVFDRCCRGVSMLAAGGRSDLHRCAGSPRLSAFCLLLNLMLLTVCCPVTRADQIEEMAAKAGIRIESRGNSSAASRSSAAALVPLHRMTPANRERAAAIIDSCSQFRRLPELKYTVDRSLYRYLLRHPDVAVSTWRVMGISEFQMLQTGDASFQASATDGSEGVAEILYQDDQEVVFVCSGKYNNILLPRPLTASALIRFRSDFQPHQNGTHLVSQQADVFVHFPSAGIAGLAKILSPVTNSLMDRNLFEVSLYAAMMSRAVHHDPHWVINMAWDLDGVAPERRRELAAVAGFDRSAETRGPVRIRPAGETRFSAVSGDTAVAEMLSLQVRPKVSAEKPDEDAGTSAAETDTATEVVAEYPDEGVKSR